MSCSVLTSFKDKIKYTSTDSKMIQMISMLTHNLFLDNSDIINVVVTHRSHWNKLI